VGTSAPGSAEASRRASVDGVLRALGVATIGLGFAAAGLFTPSLLAMRKPKCE
jgi:hypothetical protein